MRGGAGGGVEEEGGGGESANGVEGPAADAFVRLIHIRLFIVRIRPSIARASI